MLSLFCFHKKFKKQPYCTVLYGIRRRRCERPQPQMRLRFSDSRICWYPIPLEIENQNLNIHIPPFPHFPAPPCPYGWICSGLTACGFTRKLAALAKSDEIPNLLLALGSRSPLMILMNLLDQLRRSENWPEYSAAATQHCICIRSGRRESSCPRASVPHSEGRGNI